MTQKTPRSAADRDATPPLPAWHDAHEKACARGEALYPDPETGLWVFTRVGLLERGDCCDSGCRHCPYQLDDEASTSSA